MKKQLLAVTMCLVTIGSFAQKQLSVAPVSEMKEMLLNDQRYLERWNETASTAPATGSKPGSAATEQPSMMRSSSSAALNWMPFTGSRNIFGVLVSTSKPLQYNEELNVVSFVHRNSATYSPNPYPSPDPGATTGAIVAQISSDWGNTWDSTCVWNNNTNWARYPQGGIYNPPGNTNLSEAYIVATGPLTPQGGGWVGNFFASKKLDVFDNVASTVTDAQQFIQNNDQASIGKVDFARLDFTATDDGLVRSLGLILTAPLSGNFEGARICTGTFNSGIFNWTGQPHTPPAEVDQGGLFEVWPRAHMAWNESGSVGYVFFIGLRQGSTGRNWGFQPMVWKTTDAGQSWSLMPGIDFNDSTKFQTKVLDNIYPVLEDSIAVFKRRIPFFWELEGVDCTVDGNDRLHIVSTLVSSASSNTAGLAFSFSSPIDQQSGYRFDHDSIAKPIIYDFYETATGWDVAIVDTMTSERMGAASTHPAYNDNPWNPDPANQNNKVDVEARIQVSRSSDGKYIVYTWSESDPQFTSGGKRWNQLPNIKARIRHADSADVMPTKYDLTTGANQFVKNKAQFLNTSPECSVTGPVNGMYTINLPVKITNSSPLLQGSPNTHWYLKGELQFAGTDVGIHESKANTLSSVIYPNPTEGIANIELTLVSGSDVDITVLNTVGQVVKRLNIKGNTGENKVAIDLSGIAGGIYFVNVKTKEAQAIHKLLVR